MNAKQTVSLDDFKFIEKGYKKSKFWSKLVEPLYIKAKRSFLGIHGTSVLPNAFLSQQLYVQS